MKITLETLEAYEACEAQLEHFERVFPEGAEITEANCALAVSEGLDLKWLGTRLFKSAIACKFEDEEAKLDQTWKYEVQRLDNWLEDQLAYIDRRIAAGPSLEERTARSKYVCAEYAVNRTAVSDGYRKALGELFWKYFKL